MSLDEVVDIYLPLARLLEYHIDASHGLHRATAAFLNTAVAKVPYVIGLAGSVAVGKSTTSRILRELLVRTPNRTKVDLITTDGFLLPTRVLEERGLLQRKGFPESYERRALIQFLGEVKSGIANVRAPIYSHLTYDIVPGQSQVIDRPDVLIVEGLNILQSDDRISSHEERVFASDFFDFTIYVDAATEDVRRWYVERFFALRKTAFTDPRSYFRRYADLSDEDADATASRIWREINEPNLVENILPTRERAHLVLEKGSDHSVRHVRLRKL